MRSRRVELLAPVAQLRERHHLELAPELRSLHWVHFRRQKKWIDESFDIESRSSNDHRLFFDPASAFNPLVRFARPSGGGVPFFRIVDIDPVMNYAPALLRCRLAGSDVEAAIDLSRIRAQGRRVVRLADLQ